MRTDRGAHYNSVMGCFNAKWVVIKTCGSEWLAAEPVNKGTSTEATLDRMFDSYPDALSYAIEQAYGNEVSNG